VFGNEDLGVSKFCGPGEAFFNSLLAQYPTTLNHSAGVVWFRIRVFGAGRTRGTVKPTTAGTGPNHASP